MDLWSEIESLTSNQPKNLSLVEPVVITSSAIRCTIHPSEERLLVSLAQQIVENPEADSISETIVRAATALAKFDSCRTSQVSRSFHIRVTDTRCHTSDLINSIAGHRAATRNQERRTSFNATEFGPALPDDQ
jgi:hypothetical protein